MEKKSLRFSLKYYHDVYNIELKQRFFNSYKLDILDGEIPLATLITNSESGILFNPEKHIVTYNSNFFSSDIHVMLYGKEFAKYHFQAHGIVRLFRNTQTICFKDGLVLKLVKSGGFSSSFECDFVCEKTIFCTFSNEKEEGLLHVPNVLDMEGTVWFNDQIGLLHMLFMLDYLSAELKP